MLLKCLLGLVATLSYLRFFHRPWKSSAVGHVGTTVYASPWDRDSKVPSCMSMVHPQRFCSEMFRGDAAQTIIAYHSYVYIYTHIVHISYIHISNHKQCLLDHTLKRTDMWWYVPRSRVCIANQLNGFSWNPRFWLGGQAHGQHRIEVSKGAPSKLNWEAAHRRMTWFIGIPCLGLEGVKMNDNCQY